MHPQLLHQIADDSVIERRRIQKARHRHSRRPVRTRRTARVRVAVGEVLIAIGTRVAGRRTGSVGPVGFQSRQSA